MIQPCSPRALARSARHRVLMSCLLACVALLASGTILSAQEAATTQAPPDGPLVAIQEGTLPVILSAPHGGTLKIPNTDPRRGEGLDKGARGFFTGRDTGTEELCLEVAKEIERVFHGKPYFVIARFHRRYLDPNRPAKIGLEDPDAQPVYDQYHQTLAKFCREVRDRHHRGLLLDIHGQGSAKDTVFRGTQNGKTVSLLRERFGEPAHNGSASLLGTLRELGWKVHPDGEGREQSGFTGGYIVQTYGSHQGTGIDAIQLEFGGDYRATERRTATAGTLVKALQTYSERYLTREP